MSRRGRGARVALAVGLPLALAGAAPAARAADPVIRGEGAPAAVAPSERPWSVMLSGGLASYWDGTSLWALQAIGSYYPRAEQLEIVEVRPDHRMWGFGLDHASQLGPGTGVFLLGGVERRLGRLRAEAAAGLGIEQAMLRTVSTVFTYDSAMPGPLQPQVVTTVAPQYAPYARLFGTLGLELTPAVDLVLRLGVHAIAGGSPQPAFVESALGLRYRLP